MTQCNSLRISHYSVAHSDTGMIVGICRHAYRCCVTLFMQIYYAVFSYHSRPRSYLLDFDYVMDISCFCLPNVSTYMMCILTGGPRYFNLVALSLRLSRSSTHVDQSQTPKTANIRKYSRY